MKGIGLFSIFIALVYFAGIASAQASENAENVIQGNEIIGVKNSINGHALSNQDYNIRVVLDRIFVSKINNSLKISEIVVFRNEGTEIYYGKDNHTFFAVSIPLEAKNLKTQAMECCLVQEEGIVFMDPMQLIKPGDNFEMQVSYILYPQSSEYVLNKTAIYNTTSLLVFMDTKGGRILEGLYETLKLQGNEYNVIAFNDLKPGETASIPIKITQDQNYLYVGVSLFSLVSIGLVYLFRGKIFRKGKEYTLEELELEKRKIFQTIHGFEKHAGTEKSEEYRKLMEEYRQKAIQIFIKIDKIKSKYHIGI